MRECKNCSKFCQIYSSSTPLSADKIIPSFVKWERNRVSNENLMKKIEILRNRMISVGMSEGFTSPNTLRLSETLDKLINLKLSN
jgi:hypothetical protein